MIIDVHSHMGYDETFEHDFPAADLHWSQERNGVDITIVQPSSCVLLESVRRQHDAIAAFAAQYPELHIAVTDPGLAGSWQWQVCMTDQERNAMELRIGSIAASNAPGAIAENR